MLELYSCPCALFVHLRCGRMEDRAKCFRIVRSSRKDSLTDRKERDRAGEGGRFHSFQGCLQCCSLRGANQTNKKKEYCMLIVSDLSRRVFCFTTCWSRIEFCDPSIDVCVLEECFSSALHATPSRSHTRTHTIVDWHTVSVLSLYTE